MSSPAEIWTADFLCHNPMLRPLNHDAPLKKKDTCFWKSAVSFLKWYPAREGVIIDHEVIVIFPLGRFY